MSNKKIIIKNYRFSETTDLYMKQIQEKYGFESEIECLRMIIANQHAKEFPSYITALKTSRDPAQKAMDKVNAEELRDKAKADKVMKRYENICLSMDESSIVPHPQTGLPACQYPIYTTSSPHIVRRDVMVEELEVLNDDTPTLQYHGLFNETGAVGKEKVYAIIKKMEERGQPLIRE